MPRDGKESIELPWWPKPSGRSPAREPLSTDAIVAAAIKLIDAEGLDALSMRRLGQELDAGATSMYTHVRSKDELLELVVDALAGEVNAIYEAGARGSWRDRASVFARAVRRVVREEHPHAAILFLPRMALGPNVLFGMDLLLAPLREAGLEAEKLYFAYWALLTYAYGAAIREAATATAGPGRRERAPADLAAVLPAERFANVLAVAPVIAKGDFAAQFEYGLQRVLDGIELTLNGEG